MPPSLPGPSLKHHGRNRLKYYGIGGGKLRSSLVGLSAVAGLVDASLFIRSPIFGAGVPVGGAFGDFDAFLEGEGGRLAASL